MTNTANHYTIDGFDRNGNSKLPESTELHPMRAVSVVEACQMINGHVLILAANWTLVGNDHKERILISHDNF